MSGGFTLLRASHPVARKRYRCIWCGDFIQVGEAHTHESSIYDDRFQSHRFHDECLDALHDLADQEGGCIEFSPHDNDRPSPPSTLI